MYLHGVVAPSLLTTEAPLDKKPRSQKRKSPAAKVAKEGSAKAVEKKKVIKKPKVAGEWKATLHEQKTLPTAALEDMKAAIPSLHLSKSHAPPHRAGKSPKAHATSIKQEEKS